MFKILSIITLILYTSLAERNKRDTNFSNFCKL